MLKRRRHAIDHVETQRAIKQPVGERQRAHVAAPEAQLLRWHIRNRQIKPIEDETDAAQPEPGPAGTTHALGHPQHRKTQIDADRQVARAARHFERRAAKDRKSTRLNSSHSQISYAVFCLKKKKTPSTT